MGLGTWLSAPFKFAAVPVSVLAILVYGAVFSAVLVTDQTPNVPKDRRGLDLNQAYDDLHIITARPHPMHSHANDDVHNYLLDRLRPIVASQDYIHLSEDLVSNATYVTGRGATYFEGTNIFVKVDGTDAPALKPDGVVFSAHYDSVSTAPGATDNGMGVVTLLQLLEYLSNPERRPRRTAVFLFNNGEEDGLNGVHMFFEHPWSNLTKAFVNIEGAAAGGRPLLFRSTALSSARAFSAKGVRHPHGNVLSADAFARGVIRSITDYEVFSKGIKGEQDGLTGVDFAFYMNRAYYHTAFDSVPGMGRSEGRKSLWALMETVQGAGLSMLNDDETHDGDEPGVYFDVLGQTMISFSMQHLFITHIVLLILGPLVVLGLLAWVLILTSQNIVHADGEEENTLWHRLKSIIATLMGWGRFWISLVVTIGAHAGLIVGYVKLNPYVIYSKPYVVLTTTLALSFLAVTFSLTSFYKLWPSPPSSQKFAVILEIYLLAWTFLVLATIALNNLQIGGVYLITVWYLCSWLASVVALVEAIAHARKSGKHMRRPETEIIGEPEPISREEHGHRFVSGVMYNIPEHDDEEDHENDAEPIETSPTEITPLIQQQRRNSTGGREYIIGIDNRPMLVDSSLKASRTYQESGWWILQMLLLIPAPAILLFQIDLVLMHALQNTIADGSPPIIVYGGLSLLSVLVFINIAPFGHMIHRGLFLFVLAIFVIALAVAWTAFPFSQEAPLKLFFQQSVELDLSGSASPSAARLAINQDLYAPPTNIEARQNSVIRASTILTGLRDYSDRRVIPELPSSWGKELNCIVDNELRRGLWSCSWESSLLPSPGGNKSDEAKWISFNAQRLNSSSARFTIQGVNTRSCRLYFDNPITSFEVIGSGGRLQPGYEMPEEGTNNIVLWSRTWEKEFVVDVAWGGSNPDFVMGGRAACEWAEYASSTAGSPHASISAQIPAFEEVIHFLPLWATPTKWTIGLVEAWTRFSV